MVPRDCVEQGWRKPFLHVFILEKKNLFSRTSRPILIRFGTNHPWGIGDSGRWSLVGAPSLVAAILYLVSLL
jgi:hypothetical protein